MLLKWAGAMLIVTALMGSTGLWARPECEQMMSLQASSKGKVTTKGSSEWLIGSSEVRTSSGCMQLTASLNSSELKSMQRTVDGTRRVFKRNDRVVDRYPDRVELVIEIWPCFEPDGTFGRIPPEADELHFKVGWAGSNSRDNTDATYVREAWTELSPARRWYRMSLPSKGVDLSQPLEIFIESADLPEKCITGRL